jgi:hypothetical protein
MNHINTHQQSWYSLMPTEHRLNEIHDVTSCDHLDTMTINIANIPWWALASWQSWWEDELKSIYGPGKSDHNELTCTYLSDYCLSAFPWRTPLLPAPQVKAAARGGGYSSTRLVTDSPLGTVWTNINKWRLCTMSHSQLGSWVVSSLWLGTNLECSSSRDQVRFLISRNLPFPRCKSFCSFFCDSCSNIMACISANFFVGWLARLRRWMMGAGILVSGAVSGGGLSAIGRWRCFCLFCE